MKSKELANGKNHVRKKSVMEVAANQLERKVKPADIIWVKNHGGSWWPAQVCAAYCLDHVACHS